MTKDFCKEWQGRYVKAPCHTTNHDMHYEHNVGLRPNVQKAENAEASGVVSTTTTASTDREEKVSAFACFTFGKECSF